MDRKEGCSALLRPQGAVAAVVLGPQVLFCLLRCTIFKILVDYQFTIQVAILSFPPSVQNEEHSISMAGSHGAREMWDSMAWVLEVGRKEAYQEESYMWCGTENVLA